jgi:uncharacterized protein (DUF983 family)
MKTLTLVMEKEPSQFKAALHAKCPRCRTGNMFAGPMYSFGSQKMNEKCSHCGLIFEREPGYFYVAMFVSYAMNVAEMVILRHTFGCFLSTFTVSFQVFKGYFIVLVNTGTSF